MRILSGGFRVILGFIVACLVAGAATAAFVITPADMASWPADVWLERLANAGVLSLLAATHSAIFAFPFALLAIGFAEWRSVRSWIYYVIAGIAIALGGFGAEYHFEVGGQPSIINEYAVRAFVTLGFLGGLAYWLVAGRSAGTRPSDALAANDEAAEEDEEEEEIVAPVVVKPVAVQPAPKGKPGNARK